MSDNVDLSAYFARIGYDGPRTADLATLQAIHALHPAAIPFENLDPLLGRSVRLDLGSLQEKLVAQRRGGYCFEQNTLFAAVLEALGFTVTPLAARVRWLSAPGQPDGPRTHMLLRVDLPDGPFLADVGFGGHMLAAPVRLERDVEQPMAATTVRLAGINGIHTLQAALPTGWRDMYRFTLEPAVAADYAVANWFTATHPASLFTGNLLAERLTPSGRSSLFNTQLTWRGSDESVRHRTLLDANDLRETLETDFAIAPPADPAEIWARLPKG